MVLSIVGVDGAQVTHAILRRRCWYHCRMWEVGLTEGVKRWQSNWWSLKGRRSLCRRKPSQTNHVFCGTLLRVSMHSLMSRILAQIVEV